MTQPARAKSLTGLTAFHSGVAAEQSVERDYCARGYKLLANRWRGKSGEIDLVFALDQEVVFVEVKKSSTFERAAERVNPRQVQRIFATACEFVTSQPLGLLTPMRFDVALCDATGAIKVLENALHSS